MILVFRTSAELVDFGVLSTWLDIVGAVVVPLYLCCRVRSVRRCVRPLRLGVLCPAIARQRPPLARHTIACHAQGLERHELGVVVAVPHDHIELTFREIRVNARDHEFALHQENVRVVVIIVFAVDHGVDHSVRVVVSIVAMPPILAVIAVLAQAVVVVFVVVATADVLLYHHVPLVGAAVRGAV